MSYMEVRFCKFSEIPLHFLLTGGLTKIRTYDSMIRVRHVGHTVWRRIRMEKILPFLRGQAWFWPGILSLAALGTSCFGQAPIINGLVARWSGDGNAKDSAGNFDGQVSGGLRYEPGPTGQAFQFNGGSSRVDFGITAGKFGTAPF